MKKFRHIKAILCDWDDTKVATFSSCVELYSNFGKAHRLRNITREDLMQQWGKPIRMIGQGLWPDQEINELQKKFWAYCKKIQFSIKPFSKTRQTILTLKKMGYVLGVVSTGPKKSIEQTIQMYLDLPLDTYCIIQTGDDTEIHKPDPKVFDLAFTMLEKQGITDQEVLYIGDSLIDYKAALNRGISFVGVTTGITAREDFLKQGLESEAILSSFSELPYLLS